MNSGLFCNEVKTKYLQAMILKIYVNNWYI